MCRIKKLIFYRIKIAKSEYAENNEKYKCEVWKKQKNAIAIYSRAVYNFSQSYFAHTFRMQS